MHLIAQMIDGEQRFFSIAEGRRIGALYAWTGIRDKGTQFGRAQDARDFMTGYLPNEAPACLVITA